nr:immunoglobulin light chain junction region [Macaca mulatta]MOW44180.1 immunoglobulin light chain junction region [Macaca mulatta]
CMQAREFPYSF